MSSFSDQTGPLHGNSGGNSTENPVPGKDKARGEDPSRQLWKIHAPLQAEGLRLVRKELASTADLIESSASDLTRRFMQLAESAKKQSSSIEDVLNLAGKVEVDGERIPFVDIVGLLDKSLQDFVEKVVFLSKQAMAMVHTLDSIRDNLDSVEHFITDIDGIARKTTFLALNARIEAERAGPAGKTFTVVASEVRELSKQTANLAEKMQKELGAVTSAIRESHGTLESVASMDLTDTIMVKENLDRTLSSLSAQNNHLSNVLQDNVRIAGEISDNISHIITDVQYQDRTSQRIAIVVSALEHAETALTELMQDSGFSSGKPGTIGPQDLERIIAETDIGSMKRRFAETLRNYERGIQVAGIPASRNSAMDEDDIELF